MENSSKEREKKPEAEDKSKEKEFCADCKFEYKTSQMLRRQDGK